MTTFFQNILLQVLFKSNAITITCIPYIARLFLSLPFLFFWQAEIVFTTRNPILENSSTLYISAILIYHYKRKTKRQHLLNGS